MKKTRLLLSITCFHIAIAIVLGALGAHKLKTILTPSSLESFKTGVAYHLYHGIALVGLYSIPVLSNLPGIKTVRTLMALGILFFSGSIYLLSTGSITGLHTFSRILGPITPLGGILLIGSWILLGLYLLRNKDVVWDSPEQPL